MQPDEVGQLRDWLEQALSPPRGLAPEVLDELERAPEAPEGEDLYGLWAAMTVLSQEVRIQGRYFKQLQANLADRAAPPADLAPQLDGLLRELQRRATRETVELLVDLHDRLSRGRTAASEQLGRARAVLAPRWYHRLAPRRRRRREGLLAAVEALADGYRLSLERLQEALGHLGVQPVPAAGHPFDPTRMTVVDVEETDRRPEGEVVEVYIPGYTWNDEVLRPARVRVARPPREEKNGEQERPGGGDRSGHDQLGDRRALR